MNILAPMPLLSALVVGAVLGIVAGSFLAALVLRWPEGKSVLRGRSMCDSCERPLRASELIPLVSFVVLRGRCSSCGAPINALHWQMELGAGFIGAAAAFWAPMPSALGWMALGWILLALFIQDTRHYWLPDGLTMPLLALGLAIGPSVTGVSWLDSVIGAVGGWATLFFVSRLYLQLRGREGLGQGDAKLLGALGAWFGWEALPLLLLLASVLALAWVVILSITTDRRLDGAQMIAFGSFLCLAVLPLCAIRSYAPAILW